MPHTNTVTQLMVLMLIKIITLERLMFAFVAFGLQTHASAKGEEKPSAVPVKKSNTAVVSHGKTKTE